MLLLLILNFIFIMSNWAPIRGYGLMLGQYFMMIVCLDGFFFFFLAWYLIPYICYLCQSSIRPWPQSFSFQNHLSERLRDLSANNWNQLAGSGPVPWKQAPSLFNSVSSSDLHPDVCSLLELSHKVDKIYGNERLPVSSIERKNEDFSGISNWSTKLGSREMMLMNGNVGLDRATIFIFSCY